MRALTVYTLTGLSNRLFVLVSGMAIARASGREFSMLWPRTAACAAIFQELFQNDWNIQEIAAQEILQLSYAWTLSQPIPPDLLGLGDENIVMGSHHTLVRPDIYPSHAPLVDDCKRFFNELAPIPEIEKPVIRFQNHHFRPTMIGIHLRRGDAIQKRPDLMANTEKMMAELDLALERVPDAGIFLATDDGAPNLEQKQTRSENLHQRFQQRYGVRVVWTTPRSLSRDSVLGVQDGLIDLWLLRQTQIFLGTEGSAFSRLAVYGRDIPQKMCRGSTRQYQLGLKLCKISGLYKLLQWMGRREFKREIPFPVLVRYYLSKLHLAKKPGEQQL